MTKPIRVPKKLFRRLTMLAKILGSLGLSGCVLPPVAGESDKLDAVGKKKMVSILFIGNSYSFDVPSSFSKIAESRGKHLKVGHSTYGGWSLAKHMENPGTLRKLREGAWDVVVIQDYSMFPAKPERERRKIMDPGVQFFAREARAIGAVPVLYQTWGRREGDPGLAGDDFYKMNDRIRNGYLAASKNGGGIIIVKAGNAWERAFRAGRGADLFVEDGSHPSAYGNKVTAEEFYRTIFRE